MNRHAWREATREKIPIEMIALTYDDADDVRQSDHDELREIRSRWAVRWLYAWSRIGDRVIVVDA